MQIGMFSPCGTIITSPLLTSFFFHTGEDIDIRLGPSDITYLGKGKFKINDKDYQFDKVRGSLGERFLEVFVIDEIMITPVDS
jgi:hypothetical protein